MLFEVPEKYYKSATITVIPPIWTDSQLSGSTSTGAHQTSNPSGHMKKLRVRVVFTLVQVGVGMFCSWWDKEKIIERGGLLRHEFSSLFRKCCGLV